MANIQKPQVNKSLITNTEKSLYFTIGWNQALSTLSQYISVIEKERRKAKSVGIIVGAATAIGACVAFYKHKKKKENPTETVETGNVE